MTRDTFDLFAPPERGRFGDNESAPEPNPNAALVDVAMTHHRDMDRPRAALLSTDGNRIQAMWLPKSQITINPTGPSVRKRRGIFDQPVTVTMPAWLARDKGLA